MDAGEGVVESAGPVAEPVDAVLVERTALDLDRVRT
jgi:hypothetical protein